MTNPFAAAAASSKLPEQTGEPVQAAMSTVSNDNTTAPAGNLSDMFATATAAGDHAKLRDDLGEAILVRPEEWIPEMQTANGTTAAVRCDWIVLTGPNAGAVRSNSLVFNTVVRNTLKSALDGPQPFFVGIVSEGAAKPGKSSPLVFAPAEKEHLANAADAAKVNGWI